MKEGEEGGRNRLNPSSYDRGTLSLLLDHSVEKEAKRVTLGEEEN